jgi:hypothetical protein
METKRYPQREAQARAQARYKPKKSKQGFRNRYPGLDKEALFAVQGSRCAACQGTDPWHKKGWHVDHDHKTGKIRGVLCARCNLALGHAHEDSLRLRALADYVERHRNG